MLLYIGLTVVFAAIAAIAMNIWLARDDESEQ
jgi:hypothetical protein